MKKFFAVSALLLAAALAAFAPAAGAAAEAEETAAYARITEDGVYFYRSADESAGLFILPRTYFVKIVGEAGEYYRVSYLDAADPALSLTGYCRADEVTPVDYIPETPYLNYSVTVTFRAGDGSGLPDSFFTEYRTDAVYYGEFAYGSATCYYVNLDGSFGYVPAEACSAVSYPENTEHTQTETPPAGSGETAGGRSFGALNVVLVCVLAAAALGALYFLFRPARPKKSGQSGCDETEDVF